MNRKFSLIMGVCLVLTLLLGSLGSARAAAGDDPAVMPISGDTEFTVEIVPIAQLPGTYDLTTQMLAPIGYPDGEAQFEGPGLTVTGFDHGKASVCFFLSTVAVNQGWGGKVGVWTGTKWAKLETVISTTSDEAAETKACATITGNGTYAFIRYVVKPDLLPKKNPVCSEKTFAMPYVQPVTGWGMWARPGYLGLGFRGNFFFSDKVYAIGDPVKFEVLETNPAAVLFDPIVSTGTISAIFGPFPNGSYRYSVDYDPYLFYFWGWLRPFTYKLTLPDCYVETEIPAPGSGGPQNLD